MFHWKVFFLSNSNEVFAGGVPVSSSYAEPDFPYQLQSIMCVIIMCPGIMEMTVRLIEMLTSMEKQISFL